MAEQYSEHPSAEDGGELGTFQEGDLAEPFNLAFTMNAGDISEPVRSRSGLHIFFVEERSGGAESAFETAKEAIQQQLFDSKSGTFYWEWLDELKAKAYIEIK